MKSTNYVRPWSALSGFYIHCNDSKVIKTFLFANTFLTLHNLQIIFQFNIYGTALKNML